MKARELLLLLLLIAIPYQLWRVCDAPSLGPPVAADSCATPVARRERGVACVTDGTAGDGMAPARLAEWEVPLDANRATVEELASLDGIGRKLALRIRAARPFHSIEEVGRVRAVGRRRLERLRPRLKLSTSGP